MLCAFRLSADLALHLSPIVRASDTTELFTHFPYPIPWYAHAQIDYALRNLKLRTSRALRLPHAYVLCFAHPLWI